MRKALKIVLLFLSLTIIISVVLRGQITHKSFNSERWKNWKETELQMSLRWDMMNSLRKRHNLKNKTKSEIIELLGNPTSKTEFEYNYFLGMAKHGIDIGNLTFKFDKEENVINFYVTRS